ncbi:unnamed protein product [Ectocarpus fasciculatus]
MTKTPPRGRSRSPSPTRWPNPRSAGGAPSIDRMMEGQTVPGVDEDFLVREWAFTTSEVSIQQGEEGVLGRGSYGEVRVATWRGVRVAAKQLHALSGAEAAASLSIEQTAAVRRDLLKEMGLLASLRHPNLLLFLGVTYDPQTLNPRSIITELMPSSVYDLLETRGVSLEQHEVLDLASDIASGLVYIHGQSPAIVHRDISSRNVLYDGRTAKLADLGQAKAMGVASAVGGSRQTAMPGAMVYAAPEVLTGRYSSSIDVFSFGVLLAQLITGEYPRLDTRKEQASYSSFPVAEAGDRFSLLKPLLERCLSLHAEDRPAAAEALRALEALRADPCAYRPAGHGAGILADRWFQEEQKEKTRGLEARVHVHERRLSAEVGRWKEEADRADEMSGKIGAAESERDAAVRRQEELQHSLAVSLAALEEERSARLEREDQLEEERDKGRSLQDATERLHEDLLRAQRAVKSAETLQGLAEGNSTLANRAALEAKEARVTAGHRAEQAEAQLAGQVAATREAEARVEQAISRWEREKVDRLRFRKEYITKCSEAQERERTVRDLRASLKEATDRLSKYDGLPESQQIRQRMLDLEGDRQRANDETAGREKELEERQRDIDALHVKLKAVQDARDAAFQRSKVLETTVDSAQRNRGDAVKRAEKAGKALAKARKQAEEDGLQIETLKNEVLGVRKEMKRVKKDAPWLFKGGGKSQGSSNNNTNAADRIRESSNSTNGDIGEVHEQGDGGILGARCRPGSAVSSGSGSSDDEEDGSGNGAEMMVGKAAETGPRGVAELLRRHPKRHELQRRGLRALRDLAYKGDEERAAVAAAGGVAAAVHAMNRFPADSRVQVGGVKTLAHLAFGNDVNRIEVGSSGGTAAILRAMAANPADPELQGEACTAFTNLSHNCDRNRKLVVEGGGLILILNAMQARRTPRFQAFPGHSKLQRQACWALLTLAANDDISRVIASEGGVGAIIAAMINNADDTSVQHFGCWALANVGWGQADVQKFAREEGAIEAIQTAVQRFPEHQALVAKARLASSIILKGVGLAPM